MRSNMKGYPYILFVLFFMAAQGITDLLLQREPCILSGIPGEPLPLTLRVITDHTRPIQLHIPSVSNLVVRAIETIPIQQTENHLFLQERRIIWQGTEAGKSILTNLSVRFHHLKNQQVSGIQWKLSVKEILLKYL